MSSGQPFLAAPSGDDWVQIVVLVLFFGASAFSAVAKKLIEHFRERQQRSQQDRSGPPVTPTPARGPRDPAFPTARPLPPRGVEVRTPAPPVAKPFPAASAAPATLGTEVSAPPRRRPAAERPAPPTARPARAERPPRRQPAAERQKPAPPRAPKPGGVAASVNRHITEIHSRLERESAKVDAAVAANLGGLRNRMAAGDERVDAAVVSTPLGDLTIRDLRKAVLLNEILGSPIALRLEQPRW